jgi:hypothetical protein
LRVRRDAFPSETPSALTCWVGDNVACKTWSSVKIYAGVKLERIVQKAHKGQEIIRNIRPQVDLVKECWHASKKFISVL